MLHNINNMGKGGFIPPFLIHFAHDVLQYLDSVSVLRYILKYGLDLSDNMWTLQ